MKFLFLTAVNVISFSTKNNKVGVLELINVHRIFAFDVSTVVFMRVCCDLWLSRLVMLIFLPIYHVFFKQFISDILFYCYLHSNFKFYVFVYIVPLVSTHYHT